MARPAPGADRTIAVLELLARHPDDRFTLSEVARRCQLNKATAHALLTALGERGVLLRHPDDKRYSLGPRLVAIGEAARRGYTAADFVSSVLDRLATVTGLRARAWRATVEQLVCVARAALPVEPGPAAPARLPLVPPVGAVAMAWADAPTVEAWLARAGATDAVRSGLAALPAIRERGFAVTLGSPEWRALTNGPAATGSLGDPAARRSLLVAVSRQSLLVADIDDDASYPVADVTAPVFAATGEVSLTLSLTTAADDEMPGADVRALGSQVLAAADGLTAAVHGRRPRG